MSSQVRLETIGKVCITQVIVQHAADYTAFGVRYRVENVHELVWVGHLNLNRMSLLITPIAPDCLIVNLIQIFVP